MNCEPVFHPSLLQYIFCAYPDVWQQEVDIYRAEEGNNRKRIKQFLLQSHKALRTFRWNLHVNIKPDLYHKYLEFVLIDKWYHFQFK